ncbi:hypothetical protein ACSQ67_022606 [Phaseolus vulgaris]
MTLVCIRGPNEILRFGNWKKKIEGEGGEAATTMVMERHRENIVESLHQIFFSNTVNFSSFPALCALYLQQHRLRMVESPPSPNLKSSSIPNSESGSTAGRLKYLADTP